MICYLYDEQTDLEQYYLWMFLCFPSDHYIFFDDNREKIKIHTILRTLFYQRFSTAPLLVFGLFRQSYCKRYRTNITTTIRKLLVIFKVTLNYIVCTLFKKHFFCSVPWARLFCCLIFQKNIWQKTLISILIILAQRSSRNTRSGRLCSKLILSPLDPKYMRQNKIEKSYDYK